MKKSKFVGFAHLLQRAMFTVTSIDATSDEVVTPLADALGVSKDEVVNAIKAEKADEFKALIEKSKSGRVVYSKEDFEKFRTNYRNEVESDIAESAKKGNAPKVIYDTIKGAALEMTERELAKKYGIEKYTGIEDLTEKIREKAATPGSSDAQIKSMERTIEELKTNNLSLLEKVTLAEGAAKNESEKFQIKYAKDTALKNIEFKVPVEKQQKLKEQCDTLFDSKYSTQVSDNKVYAIDKATGKRVANEATLEPLPIEQVYLNVCNEYSLPVKIVETGGRGGGSSTGDSSIAAMSEAEITKYLQDKGIFYLPEGLKIYSEWKKTRTK